MQLTSLIKIVILLIGSILLWFFAPQLKFGEWAPFASWPSLTLLVTGFFLIGLGKIFTWDKVKEILRLNAFKPWLLEKLADKKVEDNFAQNNSSENFEVHRAQQAGKQDLIKRSNQVFHALKFLFRENRKRYLKTAPWYMILGEKNSGKATLIEQSGLDFSFTDKLKVEKLRQHLSYVNSLKWWFSKSAVFVGITLSDGFKTDQGEEKELVQQTDEQENKAKTLRADWLGFLRLLKRYRRRKPTNGVIVTVNLTEFLAKDTLQMQSYAHALNKQIQELAQSLKSKVPVYLVFSKCDLLGGFSEFFDDLKLEGRERVLGITLPLDHRNDARGMAVFLSEEFDKLIARQSVRILPRLASESSAKRRELILCFPQQLKFCKATLIKFIVENFAADEVGHGEDDAASFWRSGVDNYRGQFRGLYLTSGRQGGVPEDILMSAMADKLNVEKPQLFEQLQSTQSYFVRRLFKDVIIPERELVGNVPLINIRRHRRAYVLLPIFLLLLISGMWAAYDRNLLGIDQATDQAHYYQQLRGKLSLKEEKQQLIEVLPLLHTLEEVPLVYRNINQNFWLPFGLGTIFFVDHAAKQALHNQLQETLLPRVKNYLEGMLSDDVHDARYVDDAYSLYIDLKAYLTLNLTEQMPPYWVKPAVFAGLEKDPGMNQTQKFALKKFIELAVQDGFRKQVLDKSLVEAARSKLRQISLAKRAYWYIKEKDLFGDENELNINDKIGSSLGKLFADGEKLPIIKTFFTAQGFEYIYRKSDKDAVDEVANADLVMGVNSVRLSKAEKEHASEELRDIYANEYYQQWQELLGALQVADFQDLEHAVRVLEVLISPTSSPIAKVLDLVNVHTEPLVHNNLGGGQFFKTLDRVTEQQGTENAQLIEINKTLVKLHDFIAKLDNETDPRVVHKTAVDLINGAIKGDPITQLYKLAQALPAPLNQWYMNVAQNSLKVILKAALQVINSDWQEMVIGEYQSNLAGRYPIDQNATAEISLESFSHFFAPQGTFDLFYQKDLQALIDNRNWQLKSLFGQTIGISAGSLEQLIKMINVRDKYFAEGSKQPKLKFTIKPLTLTEKAARMDLHLGDQVLSYAHGPQRGLVWQWPALSNSQEAGVVFALFNGNTPSAVYQGTWSWFKLLNAAAIHGDSSDTYSFKAKAADGSFADFQLISPAGLAAFNLDWLQTSVLPERL